MSIETGKFTVHRANQVPIKANVTFEGQELEATVWAYEVELTSPDPRMGGITLRLLNVPNMLEEFAVDRTGTLVWVPDEAVPAPVSTEPAP